MSSKRVMGRPVQDLTGQRFGSLTVIRQAAEQTSGTSQRWLCRCDCGNETIVAAGNLKSGSIVSCSCHRQEQGIEKLYGHRDKVYVDSTNLDTLTNRPTKKSSTGVRGVYRRRGGYYARITIKGKVIYLGDFATLEEAAEARRKAEEKHFNPVLEKYGKETL